MLRIARWDIHLNDVVPYSGGDARLPYISLARPRFSLCTLRFTECSFRIARVENKYQVFNVFSEAPNPQSAANVSSMLSTSTTVVGPSTKAEDRQLIPPKKPWYDTTQHNTTLHNSFVSVRFYISSRPSDGLLAFT